MFFRKIVDWLVDWVYGEEEEYHIGFEPVHGAPDDTILPRRSTKASAGYDFYAPEDMVIKKGMSDTIWLNVKAYMPDFMYLRMENRSGIMAKKDTVLFCSGIIDSDYYSNPNNDGNIGIRFWNLGEEFEVKKGERICQGIFLEYYVTDDDVATEQRVAGFGSTGK